MALNGVGLQMCYRRVCLSTAGDWGSNNPVLALSLRRCRTTAYTSSTVPRFTNMLLSPRPFGSRSVVRLGVISPELRPPLVAIPSVRDTAHTFLVYGLAPAVPLRDPRSVPSHFASSTGVHPWTARAFAGYLWSGLSTGEGPSPSVLILVYAALPRSDYYAPSDFPGRYRIFIRLSPSYFHHPYHPSWDLPCSHDRTQPR
jgi:hypothetical protein